MACYTTRYPTCLYTGKQNAPLLSLPQLHLVTLLLLKPSMDIIHFGIIPPKKYFCVKLLATLLRSSWFKSVLHFPSFIYTVTQGSAHFGFLLPSINFPKLLWGKRLLKVFLHWA